MYIYIYIYIYIHIYLCIAKLSRSAKLRKLIIVFSGKKNAWSTFSHVKSAYVEHTVDDFRLRWDHCENNGRKHQLLEIRNQEYVFK